MTKKNAKKKAKKWSKIWVLNWLTMAVFITCMSIIFIEEMLNFFTHYQSSWHPFNFETWRPVHFIGSISGGFLLVEQIALLKTKNIDLLKTVNDIEGLKNKKKSYNDKKEQ